MSLKSICNHLTGILRHTIKLIIHYTVDKTPLGLIPGYSIGQQQDAAEFLTRIIGGINDLFTCQRLGSQVESWSAVLWIKQ